MLTIETHGRVAVLNIDDGKANVVSDAFSKALNEGLDTAERDADAVLIVGRPHEQVTDHSFARSTV
jgi:enoyl-CoA hydratase/carnithine racemase